MELREALEAAATEQEKDDATQATPELDSGTSATVADESAETPETGADSEPETGKTEPVQTDAGKPAAEAAPAPGQHRVDRAPASWRKEAKGEWAAVPLHIRQEVHRRELEVNRALSEAAQARQQAGEFGKVVEPYMARIQSFGVTPQQAIGQLLQADYTLATASKTQRAQFMAKLCRDYDVDVVELDAAIVAGMQGQTAQQPAAQQPDIQALVQQQLQQALAPIYQERQVEQQRQQAQVDQTVEQMALDPQYPHFDAVREDMADMIEMSARRGVALSLSDAYTRAVAFNPQVNQMQTAQQQNLQAQRAKAASRSVTGSPAAGGSNEFTGDGSLRGSLEAAFANLRA
jgi:hypothetical protein